jgi:hypothetical protein
VGTCDQSAGVTDQLASTCGERGPLFAGFHVVGTVRSLARPERYNGLRRMAAEEGSPLELVESDLEAPGAFVLETLISPAGESSQPRRINPPPSPTVPFPGSFDKAVQGCRYVFHVASPVVYK